MHGYLLAREQIENWVSWERGITTAAYEESSCQRARLDEVSKPGWEATLQGHLHDMVFEAALGIIYSKTRLGGGRLRVVRLGKQKKGLCFELANKSAQRWPVVAPTLPPADQVELLKAILGTTEEPKWYARGCN
jgi:hypothetical protein